ncbi:hypothetical protein ACFVIM_13625 [Streptomyces sp. NPDC057638]|uniref:hypothetical protein n=1 Tax=Streptomyces sp. NPDC057638 TaxID=3346190 RepID=UPI0036D18AAC
MGVLVEEDVAGVLWRTGGETIRVYVAACVERMAPLFLGVRAVVAEREADRDLYAQCRRDLWFADRVLTDAADRIRIVERFPELRPRDEPVTSVADTYAAPAVLALRHALAANNSGSARDAVSCGHAVLVAMEMLDQSLGSELFGQGEYRLQRLSVSGDIAGLWEASVAVGQERFRAVLGQIPPGTS